MRFARPRRSVLRLAVGCSIALLAASAPPASATITKTFTGRVDASGTKFVQHLFDVVDDGLIAATSTTAKPESISYADGTVGTWKVGVKAVSGAANYTVTVSHSPGATASGPPEYVATIGGGGAGHAEMYPSGVDVDPSGNVYVADTGDDQVQKYDANGQLLWTTGSRGPKAPGRFENPRDVAFLNGKVYVADTGYNRVQVLNASDGSVSTVWSTRFGTIMGISAGVDGGGNAVILVSESSANTIRVYTPGGALIRSVGSGPGNGHGQLNAPRDAATDASGQIFVADYLNSRVAVFGPTGTPIVEWGVNGTGPTQLKRPYGIDLDDAGDVYVADSNNYIHKFTAAGQFLRAYGSPGSGPGRFLMLRRVAVQAGSSPRVYGADLWTYKVEAFAQDGTNLPSATLGGMPPQDGYFNEPYGVTVDATNIFVMDMVNQRVQRFATSTRAFQLAWGERGWGEGNPGFNWARDVAIGVNGGSRSVWVADTKNNRVSEFWPDGSPTGRRFGTTGSAIGQLNWPFAVASYGSHVIVADTLNNRVQRWDPSGPSVVWTSTGPAGAPLSAPKDISVWGDQVYVADTLNRRVVVLSATDGSVLRTLTGGGAIHLAEGIAVDPSGDIWVADTNWNRLVELSPTGSVLQTFGGLGSGPTQLNKPTHLEIPNAGAGQPVYLYLVDSWNDRIQIFRIG
jgi:tripartite motif-containing protein 71